MSSMGVGVSDGKTLDVAAETLGDKDRNRKRRTDNKTVTFGDGAAVRSLPYWSAASFIALMVLWWAITRAWGFPEEFKDTAQAAFKESQIADGLDSFRLSDKRLFEQCQISDACDVKSYTQVLSPLTFPTPIDTWYAAGELFTDGFRNVSIWSHTWASLYRVLKGMFWGSLIGIPVGLSMGLSSKARGFFDTIVEAFRPIPPLALLPLFTLSFGLGEKAAVPLLVFASVWIMIIAARSGIKNAKISKVRAAYSLGASKSQLLRKVLIPNALPEIFTGIRVALGVSWGTLVAAELSGVQEGLGAMISFAKNFSRLDVIVVGIVIIAVLGILMDLLIRLLESILIPWQGKG